MSDHDETTGEVAEDQIAFDLGAFPGGARAALEAVLMVVDDPVSEPALASALELSVEDVHEHLLALEDDYTAAQRGFTLRNVAGGWRMYSRSEFAPVVERFVLDGQQAKLTQASLETLAVIAYRQPVSRARVSAVRGVSVDGVVRTLLTRGLIEEVEDTGESGATLYRTTPYFLQRMGLSSLDELPALAPYLPDADVIDELVEEGHV
ncbi:MAG: SMC-Scp complex subunit ScpB [Intrasporangium sp.]|uniref:SMC-Scp complex subunit ScpB n=1 Tax=Intrasporangium sp. TaxID=1925024 RepID=UPI003F81E873